MKQGLFCLFVFCVLMSGCSNLLRTDTDAAKPPAPANQRQAWQQRQQRFAGMQEWFLKGRVGLQLKQQSWSFGLDWTQRANGQYQMNIANPLTGSLLADIRNTGQQVVLKAADGKTYRDTDAERLLQRQLKLRFPLNNMRYWARGIPVPGVAVQNVQLDAQGRPLLLQQQDWVVRYTAYKDKGYDALPRRIQLEKASEQVKAKVVARQWKTRF